MHNGFLMKKLFSQTKRIKWEEWICFKCGQISLLSYFNGMQLDSYICFQVQLVEIFCFDWSTRRKSSHTHIQTHTAGKKEYFNGLFRQLWIFFFDTHQKLYKWQLLELVWVWNQRPYQWVLLFGRFFFYHHAWIIWKTLAHFMKIFQTLVNFTI